MNISVITPTWHRPQLLANCLRQVRYQTVPPGIEYEHIVVSDGPDDMAEALALHWHARYYALPTRVGDWGKACLDLGLAHSEAEYVVFWDDDNIYPQGALDALYRAVVGRDVGVVPIYFWNRRARTMLTIPAAWDGQFTYAQCDTACVCLRRQFLIDAGTTPGTIAPGQYDADYRLLRYLGDNGANTGYIDEPRIYHI